MNFRTANPYRGARVYSGRLTFVVDIGGSTSSETHDAPTVTVEYAETKVDSEHTATQIE